MSAEDTYVRKGNGFLNAAKSLQKFTNPFQKRRITIIIVLTFISAILDVVGLAAVLPLIQAGTNPEMVHTNPILSTIYNYFSFESEKYFILFLIGGLMGYFVIKTAFGIFVNWMQARVISNIAVHIAAQQYSKYYKLNFLDFNNIRSSVMIRNILYNPTNYVQWILQPLTMIVSETFIVLLIIGAIAFYDLFLFSFILVTIGPATYLVYTALRNRGTRIGVGIDNVFPYALSTLTESIHGYIDVKLSGNDNKYKKRFLVHLKNYQELMQSAALLSYIPLRLNEIIALMGIVLIFIYALFLSNSNPDVIVLVGAFAAAAYRLMPSMNRLLNSFTYLNKNQISIFNLELYDSLVRKDYQNLSKETVSFNQSIELRDISFSFPNTNKTVLNNLNFIVKKGEKVGFIGSSGSGKTTLMNLLLRFYKENSGEILVDGIALRDEQTVAWRSLIGYVKQDIFLVDGSVKENVTFGETDVDEVLLDKSIKLASLEALVNGLPDGINSTIGEKGSSISGGQRQRIGIARSLYRNAEILIFDEATSALDNETESEVTDAINSLSSLNKTVFIIAHRYTTLRNCDRIYELKDGKISGVYTYQDLFEKSNS